MKKEPHLETDPRFPSGPWTGFWLQKAFPGRHTMELHITFQNGVITGEGRDWVGQFLLRGRYNIANGVCYWTKRYLAQHDVFYKGYNEGKGIWGTWEIANYDRGGFHIWPEGMPDPTKPGMHEQADVPAPFDDLGPLLPEIEEEELVPAPSSPR
ncbi:MAG: hypothetical protein KatS3mg105_1477 [Gemmatales bacterium]|nr:MAG: hypothetical protein KatS3mg105_1477 [Gemmatales bacterium]